MLEFRAKMLRPPREGTCQACTPFRSRFHNFCGLFHAERCRVIVQGLWNKVNRGRTLNVMREVEEVSQVIHILLGEADPQQAFAMRYAAHPMAAAVV